MRHKFISPSYISLPEAAKRLRMDTHVQLPVIRVSAGRRLCEIPVNTFRGLGKFFENLLLMGDENDQAIVLESELEWLIIDALAKNQPINFTYDTILDTLNIANKYGIDDLEREAQYYLQCHLDSILEINYSTIPPEDRRSRFMSEFVLPRQLGYIRTVLLQDDIRRFMGTNFIGPKEWNAVFGEGAINTSEVPELPQCIIDQLLSPCPFCPEEYTIIAHTHILFFMPTTLNNKPLTLLHLAKLSESGVSKLNDVYQLSTFSVPKKISDDVTFNTPLKKAQWVIVPTCMPNVSSIKRNVALKSILEATKSYGNNYKTIEVLPLASSLMFHNLSLKYMINVGYCWVSSTTSCSDTKKTICLCIKNTDSGRDVSVSLHRPKDNMYWLQLELMNRPDDDDPNYKKIRVVAGRKSINILTHKSHILGTLFDHISEETDSEDAYITVDTDTELSLIYRLANHIPVELTHTTVLTILRIADKYNIRKLWAECRDYLIQHRDSILRERYPNVPSEERSILFRDDVVLPVSKKSIHTEILAYDLRTIMGQNFTGIDEWNDLMEEDVLPYTDIPELPADIVQVVMSPCPMSSDDNDIIAQTHILFLLPAYFDGIPLTLMEWHRMSSQDGICRFSLNTVRNRLKDTYFGHMQIAKMQWVLMPMHHIKSSTNKSLDQQRELLSTNYPQYEEIDPLVLVSGIFLHFNRTNTIIMDALNIRSSLPDVFGRLVLNTQSAPIMKFERCPDEQCNEQTVVGVRSSLLPAPSMLNDNQGNESDVPLVHIQKGDNRMSLPIIKAQMLLGKYFKDRLDRNEPMNSVIVLESNDEFNIIKRLINGETIELTIETALDVVEIAANYGIRELKHQSQLYILDHFDDVLAHHYPDHTPEERETIFVDAFVIPNDLQEIRNIRLQNAIRSLMGNRFTGLKEWKELFGDDAITINDVPSLPEDILKQLSNRNPLCLGRYNENNETWEDYDALPPGTPGIDKSKKTVADTHIFFLMPSHVNGKPLTITEFHQLVKDKKTIDGKRLVTNVDETETLRESCWILLPSVEFECSSGRMELIERRRDFFSYHERYPQANEYQRIKRVLDFMIGFTLHVMRTGENISAKGNTLESLAVTNKKNDEWLDYGFKIFCNETQWTLSFGIYDGEDIGSLIHCRYISDVEFF